MDGWDVIMLNEVRVRQTNTVCFNLNAVSKKYNKHINTTKQKQIHRYREKLLPVGRGGRAGQERGRGLRDTNY